MSGENIFLRCAAGVLVLSFAFIVVLVVGAVATTMGWWAVLLLPALAVCYGIGSVVVRRWGL